MGLSVSRINFETGLPLVEHIRKQFENQTGLEIWIRANVNLVELPLNSREVILKLNQDLTRYEEFNNKTFNENWEELREERKKINFLDHFQFFNHQFYEIDFHIEGNTIEIEYLLGCFYFPKSLEKALYDLGGKFEDFDKKIKKDWKPPKYWNKLRHWDDYKWFNRPRR